jgi:hypothetical protein
MFARPAAQAVWWTMGAVIQDLLYKGYTIDSAADHHC